MLFADGSTIFDRPLLIQVEDLQLLLAQNRGNGLFEVAEAVEDVLNAQLLLHFLKLLKKGIRLLPLKLEADKVKHLLDVDCYVMQEMERGRLVCTICWLEYLRGDLNHI